MAQVEADSDIKTTSISFADSHKFCQVLANPLTKGKNKEFVTVQRCARNISQYNPGVSKPVVKNEAAICEKHGHKLTKYDFSKKLNITDKKN